LSDLDCELGGTERAHESGPGATTMGRTNDDLPNVCGLVQLDDGPRHAHHCRILVFERELRFLERDPGCAGERGG